MDLKFLRGLIRALDESGLDSIEITRGGTRVRLARTPAPNAMVEQGDRSAGTNTGVGGNPAAPAGQSGVALDVQATGSPTSDVVSPMVGTFYRAPAPDALPYVEVGSRVSKGDTLCMIEAMKLMNELESEIDGTVAEICVENAEPVEYGQVLFRIRPRAASSS
ncbi:MAG: acetyl-CoA carboxylase biotin carboxyl carrier protein [Gemmatimonadetes bacterium]|nr:acetyl-CoA carboxylase biotin carboxyl carrier protein [Gemmatimonadota bacterium]